MSLSSRDIEFKIERLERNLKASEAEVERLRNKAVVLARRVAFLEQQRILHGPI